MNQDGLTEGNMVSRTSALLEDFYASVKFLRTRSVTSRKYINPLFRKTYVSATARVGMVTYREWLPILFCPAWIRCMSVAVRELFIHLLGPERQQLDRLREDGKISV